MEIITGIDHEATYFPSGIEYEKDMRSGEYTLLPPAGCYFVETQSHILGWAGDTYKEALAYSKAHTFAKCFDLDDEGDCIGH